MMWNLVDGCNVGSGVVKPKNVQQLVGTHTKAEQHKYGDFRASGNMNPLRGEGVRVVSDHLSAALEQPSSEQQDRNTECISCIVKSGIIRQSLTSMR